MLHALLLAASFAIILAGSEMFTNAVEWVGEHLNVSEAAVGSLLAAVGTALPETFIPVVAILVNGGAQSQAVGVGAIVGAPLMLSTVALLVMGSALIVYRRRRSGSPLRVPGKDAQRDLSFFMVAYGVAVLTGLFPVGRAVRIAVALGLLVIYGFYSFRVLRTTRPEETEVEHGLYLERLFRGRPKNPRRGLIFLQVGLGVLAILIGAREFVAQIVALSHTVRINPGVLSLILSPLATELPEKYNSVIWIRQRKDHLALANITGAMVFQSCIPVAIGLAFTPWDLEPADRLGCLIALLSAGLLYINVRDGVLGLPTLMVGGVAYAIFLAGVAYLGAF